MPSLNGDVRKCPHGLFKKNPNEIADDDPAYKPLRCKFCHAKLLPNEFSTEKNESSKICCSNGQVDCGGEPWQMSSIGDPPKLIKDLFSRLKNENKDYEDPYFMRNCRKYNNALCMASIGFDEELVQKHGWTPNIKIHGKIYHRQGPLLPEPGQQPKFAQIIVHDGNLEEEQMYLNQLKRRMEVFNGKSSKALQEKYAKAKAAIEVNSETMDQLQ